MFKSLISHLELKSIRWIAFVILVSVASIAGLFFAITSGQSQQDGQRLSGVVIDTRSPTQLSQCTPCHSDLDDFYNPNLIFKHTVHFENGVSCDRCHTQFAHQRSGTVKPTMESCRNCHGLYHSQQGLGVDGDCGVCHPPSFNRRPSSHTSPWEASLHKNESKENLYFCMMCHRGTFCEECHAIKGVKPAPEENYRYEGFFPRPILEGITINISEPVTLGQCNQCHSDLDAFENPGLIFGHGIHFEKGVKCDKCHLQFPHSQNQILRPTMDICYGCHGLRHGNKGLVAGENCDLCHTPEFNLIPANHTSEFKSKLHKDEALRDRLYCSMCHTEEWCQACHNSRKIIPEDHEQKQMWRELHGKGEKGTDDCASCHSTLFCDDCHGTPIPHSLTWMGKHSEPAKEESATCKACHQQEEYCQDCHHNQLASNILVQKNCEKCHSDYKLPLLLVRGRTHMVHKAHFELTNREPFKCDDCHALRIAKATGLQYYAVCYECHGKYRLGKLVAKWGGYELCYRCHQASSGGAPMGQQLPGIPVPGPATPGPGIEQQLRPRQ